MTSQDCLAQAAEAEGLARLVSLETDKARLRAMAKDWRRRAAALEESRSFAPMSRERRQA